MAQIRLSASLDVDAVSELLTECKHPFADSYGSDPDASLEFLDNRTIAYRQSTPSTFVTTDAEALVLRWSWQSRTRGRRPMEATVIDVIAGGQDVGEGWALRRRYLSMGALTPAEVHMFATLAERDACPVLVSTTEL